MSAPEQRLLEARSSWPAMLLTWTSGFVDVVGYSALLHVFTANMTGNTVHLGRAIATGDVREIADRGLVIVTFMAGLLASRLSVDVARRISFRRIAGLIFFIEALMLTMYAIAGAPLLARGNALPPNETYSLLLVLVAGAMGLQNAAMTHFGPLTVRTTHVTGTLAELAEDIAQVVIRIAERTPSAKPFREMLLLAATWCCYLTGAIVATLALLRWSLASVALPVGALLFLVVFDTIRPMIVFEREGANTSRTRVP